ncbi:MAG TPA: DedA family protein [Caulobacteraceae bacterium]|jgi:membrane protein DedA with SNARE-associated domain
MPHLWPIVASYGYAAVFVLLLVESIGLPAPGEGVLIVTALFAARTHRLDIAIVILTAAAGAFAGSSLGYLLGRAAGTRLLLRYGRYVGLNPARQRLGQYLFLRHGAKIVFLGRFIAFLRAFAGLLAGLNRMPLGRFLAFNALGAAAWTTTIGLGAYTFGHVFVHVSRPVGAALVVLGLLALVAALLYVRRREADLQKLADAALVATP